MTGDPWPIISYAPAPKFPDFGYNYELSGAAGLYVVGELMHAHDYRVAAGGFIQGHAPHPPTPLVR